MIERVLELLPAIRSVLVQDRKYSHLNPTWQDVSVLESINAAMKPLADLTDVLSGEKYVTVSSVKPVLELIKDDLLSPGPDDTALTAGIKQNMCRVLTEKYKSPAIQVLLRKATILDPRYRGSMEEAEALDGPILMSRLTDIDARSCKIIKSLGLSQCRIPKGLSPHLPSPFRGSASVQTSPERITHSSRRCDV